jgi:hypothetical protein
MNFCFAAEKADSAFQLRKSIKNDFEHFFEIPSSGEIFSLHRPCSAGLVCPEKNRNLVRILFVNGIRFCEKATSQMTYSIPTSFIRTPVIFIK